MQSQQWPVLLWPETRTGVLSMDHVGWQLHDAFETLRSRFVASKAALNAF